MIKQSTIQQIMATAKVEEVIEDFVTLKRRGVNMLGLCPFHDEKTPSFTVSPAKNIYKCFGCGKAGDPVRFMMDLESLTYPEALRYLANRYNIDIEETEDTKEEKAIKELNASYYIINEFAQEYFSNQLHKTDEGRSVGLSYFKERGFNESTIKKFGLGYTSNEANDFTKTAISKQFNEEYLVSLGLTSKNGYDFFRSRVMFAIHNLSGKIIAFAGRTLSSDKKVPKYINSPETDVYNKRKVLYGMYFAKTAIKKEDECILVEGYTDVITLHQYGIENVVASSGTSLTIEQIALIRRFTPNIKIIYDGDPAGIKAAMRGLDLVLEQDLNVKLVLLPDGQDPDSYMKSIGVDAYRRYLKEHEEDFVLFKTNLLLKEVGNDPIRKTEVLKDIVRSIAKIPDMIKRSLYIQKCATMLDIAENILVSETNRIVKADLKQKSFSQGRQSNIDDTSFISSEAKHNDDQVRPIKQIVTGDDYQERDLLRVIITLGNQNYHQDSNHTVAGYIFDCLKDEIEYFDNSLFKEMFITAFDQYQATGRIDTDSFVTSSNEEVRSIVIDFLATPYSYASWEKQGVVLNTQNPPEENQDKDAYQAVLRFLIRKSDKKLKKTAEIIAKLQSEDPENKNLIKYLKVYKKIQEERTGLADQMGNVVLK